jgi:hypothetical protein
MPHYHITFNPHTRDARVAPGVRLHFHDDGELVPLDPDLIALARGKPFNIIQQIYQMQAERNQYRVPFRDDGAEWVEEEHKRDKGGKFSSAGGGGKASTSHQPAPSEMPSPLPSPAAGGATHGMLAATVNKNMHKAATAAGFEPTGVPLQYHNPTTGAKITGKPGGYWTGTMPGKKDVTGKSGASLKAFLESGRKGMEALANKPAEFKPSEPPPHENAPPPILKGSLIADVINQFKLKQQPQHLENHHVFTSPEGAVVTTSHHADENGKIKWAISFPDGTAKSGTGAFPLSDALGVGTAGAKKIPNVDPGTPLHKVIEQNKLTISPDLSYPDKNVFDAPDGSTVVVNHHPNPDGKVGWIITNMQGKSQSGFGAVNLGAVLQNGVGTKTSLSEPEPKPAPKTTFGQALNEAGFESADHIKPAPGFTLVYHNPPTGDTVHLNSVTGSFQVKNSLGGVMMSGEGPDELDQFLQMTAPPKKKPVTDIHSLVEEHQLIVDPGEDDMYYHNLKTPGGMDIEISKEPNDEGVHEWSIGDNTTGDQYEAGAGYKELSAALHHIEPLDNIFEPEVEPDNSGFEEPDDVEAEFAKHAIQGDPGAINAAFEAKHKRDALGHFLAGMEQTPEISDATINGGQKIKEFYFPAQSITAKSMAVHVFNDGSGWEVWRSGDGVIAKGSDLASLQAETAKHAPLKHTGGGLTPPAEKPKISHPDSAMEQALTDSGATLVKASNYVDIYTFPDGKKLTLNKYDTGFLLQYDPTNAKPGNGAKMLSEMLAGSGGPKPPPDAAAPLHPNSFIAISLNKAGAKPVGSSDPNVNSYEVGGGLLYVHKDVNAEGKSEWKHILPKGDGSAYVIEGAGANGLEDHLANIPPPPAAAGPKAPTAVAHPVDGTHWKKLGSNLGSNPGGTYEDPDTGKKYYVKDTKSVSHAQNEMLAASLYSMAGVPTLTYHQDTDYPERIVTDWSDAKMGTANMTLAEQNEAFKQYAVHAWLANWDAVGLADDNMGVINGKVTPMDVGGALIYRAQGGLKGSAFDNDAGEWESMKSGYSNPQAVAFFSKAAPEQLQEGAKAVAAISNSDIIAAVAKFGPGTDEEKIELAKKLIKRRDAIAAQAGIATAPGATPGAVPPEKAPPKKHHTNGNWDDTYKARLKQAPIPTKAEAAAIFKYSGGSYDPWNEALRGSFGKKSGGYPTDALASYLSKASLPEAITVKRRVSSDFAEWLMEETQDDVHIFQDFGFASTDHWSGKLTLKINLPKGAQAAAIGHYSDHPGENEILIQRGSKFRIDNFDPNKLEMEVTLMRSGRGAGAVHHEKLSELIQPSPQPLAA